MPWTYNTDLDAFSIYHLVQEEHQSDEDASLLPALGHAIAGASGTAISNVLIYPLSLVITRLQVQARPSPPSGEKGASSDEKSPARPKYDGIQDAVIKIYKDEGGISAFYAGVAQDTTKSIVDSFIFFLGYNFLKRFHRNTPRAQSPSPFLDDIAIGMLAGAATKGLAGAMERLLGTVDSHTQPKPDVLLRFVSAEARTRGREPQRAADIPPSRDEQGSCQCCHVPCAVGQDTGAS
ncbi:hypothetical protein FH972_023327 [Carpinus fangiana]|uniref:Uncharacterized protein n=1 Tax=Carpinus fangiana TaxID=176857 RepID=A0A5N6KVC8_9ROSI|nr:hypothetical protein FH972_023327 [Carpinus fangiana]